MLRRLDAKKPVTVVPIDSGLSEWRTVWVGDTVTTDGIQWLAKNKGGDGMVLLLVYPQVGADFTGRVLRAYSKSFYCPSLHALFSVQTVHVHSSFTDDCAEGDTIVLAGTQNTNGYTAFAKETIAQWMAREMPEYNKVLQIPLPSFAGKDEALFAFQRPSTS